MADLITGEAFGQLFRTFLHSARRLETRDRYRDPEEDDAFARYLTGSPDDPGYVAARDYWLSGTIRAAVDAGRRFTRVRVVPEPLTPYLRFGLYHCAFNVDAGEDIRYLSRDRANALDLPGHDFWLFDEQRLALLWFTPTTGYSARSSAPSRPWYASTCTGSTWPRHTPRPTATTSQPIPPKQCRREGADHRYGRAGPVWPAASGAA